MMTRLSRCFGPIACTLLCLTIIGGTATHAHSQPMIGGKPYKIQPGREATRQFMLRALTGIDVRYGDWYIAAPYPNPAGAKGFGEPTPFETTISHLKANDKSWSVTTELAFRKYIPKQDAGGTGGELPIDFREGLKPEQTRNQVGYLYRSISVDKDVDLPVSMGADDGLRVWLNGQMIVDAAVERPLNPDDHHVVLNLKAGLNHLLVKVSQGAGEWAFAMAAQVSLDPVSEAALDYQLDNDFPDREAVFYRIVTIPVPEGIVAEVGGLDTLPGADGRPILCTRRGDVYIVSRAYDMPALKSEWKLFATGLQEPLGIAVRPDQAGKKNWAAYTAQRSELTKLIDTDGDDVADSFETICDAWKVSGNYHEYAFGPKFDREGNAWVTLNLAHSDVDGTVMGAPVATRGCAVKITPDGVMHLVADGLRSPDGLGMFSDGQMFYTDNQGDFVATCKLSPLYQDSFHGHQASLKFRKGWEHWKQDGKPLPEITPAAVWFPYQKMGQSASDILLDDTNGLFGPFTGQFFVGDQTHATIMRVFLEKVTGADGKTVYQGACFPFRSGFASGVHRLAWGADGSMFVGMTDRGWGSTGPKRYGLQRLVKQKTTPFEIKEIRAKPDGFELEFTDTVTPGSASESESYRIKSYTYEYHPQYGSDEMDTRTHFVKAVTVINDRTVKLFVDKMRPDCVYEFDVPGVMVMRSPLGPLLHTKAYYTMHVLPAK